MTLANFIAKVGTLLWHISFLVTLNDNHGGTSFSCWWQKKEVRHKLQGMIFSHCPTEALSMGTAVKMEHEHVVANVKEVCDDWRRVRKV